MPDTTYDLNSSGIGGGGFGGFGGGFGGGLGGFGLVGLIGLNNLFGHDGRGERRGGDNGGDDCRDVVWQSAVMSKLGTLEAGQPLSVAALQASIAGSTTAVRDTIQTQSLGQLSAIAQLALAGQQGFSNLKDATQGQFFATAAEIGGVKDTVQLGIHAQSVNALELANLINTNTCSINQAILADGALTRSLIDQRYIDSVKDELSELRHDHRARGAEINVSQIVNQSNAQAQAQQQQQQQQQAIYDLHSKFNCFLGQFNQFQAQRATAGAVQFGTGNIAAQSPTNTANQVGGF